MIKRTLLFFITIFLSTSYSQEMCTLEKCTDGGSFSCKLKQNGYYRLTDSLSCTLPTTSEIKQNIIAERKWEKFPSEYWLKIERTDSSTKPDGCYIFSRYGNGKFEYGTNATSGVIENKPTEALFCAFDDTEEPTEPMACEVVDSEKDGPSFEKWLSRKKSTLGASKASVGSISKNGQSRVCFYDAEGNLLGCGTYNHKRKTLDPCDVPEDEQLDPQVPCVGDDCDDGEEGGENGDGGEDGDGGNDGDGGEDGDGGNDGDGDNPKPPVDLEHPKFECGKDDLFSYMKKHPPTDVIKDTKLTKFLDSVFPSFPSGQCPNYSIPNLFGGSSINISPPCWIFSLMQGILLIVAVLLCRKIIMGV